MVHHVVIVGGGFAGVSCARQLAQSPDIHITLIDKHNYRQFQPLLYQLATSEIDMGEIATPLREFFSGQQNVDVKMDEVTFVDPKTRSVKTKDGQTYQGDYLVLAAGSQVNFFDTRGAEQYSFPLYSLEDAEKLRSRILTVFEAADRDTKLLEKGVLNFVIVGGGPTGTEMAGALAEMIQEVLPKEFSDLPLRELARIYLIDYGHALLGTFSEKSQEYAAKVLQERGVILRMGMMVKEVARNYVLLSDGTKLLTQTVIWAGGSKASNLASHCNLPQGRGGRIPVNSDLTAIGFPNVYVVGDFGNMPGKEGDILPQLGSVAYQAGAWAATNIASSIADKPRKPFEYHDKGVMAMIGRNAAVAEVGAKHHQLQGPIAFAAWLGVHAALMATFRQKVEAFLEWSWNYFGKKREFRIIDRSDVESDIR